MHNMLRDLDQHIKGKHSSTKCEYCDHEAKDMYNMRKHLKACKDTKERFVCEHCDKQYSTVFSRANHVREKHLG